MDVTVTEAEPNERNVLAQLLELNAYELSRIDGRSIGGSGATDIGISTPTGPRTAECPT